MSTVVAVDTPTGVAIAGDTGVVDGEAVSSDQFRRVFDLSGVGIGVVGESREVQQFRRWFEVAIQDRGLESGDIPDIDTDGEVDLWTLGSADWSEQGVCRFGEEAEQ